MRDEGVVSITVRNVPGLPGEGNGSRRGDYMPSLVYAFGMHEGWNDLASRLITVGDGALQVNQAMTASSLNFIYYDQSGLDIAYSDDPDDVDWPDGDFVVAEESDAGLPGLVNLIGIESPGLTAAPAIAERVVRLLRER